ncbi:MAG: 1-phosphofructokinase [Eubacteriales bacterium]|nr:1-phosphofructokinase [Eubacteriales bacterium]
MIYTLTFNPSVDYIVGVEHFRAGEINRTSSEKVLPGGKGLNVSMVLSNLGRNSVALGFLAGFTGREIEDRMRAFGCMTDFIYVREGFSRINLKMMSDEETAINGQGPKIDSIDIKLMENKLDKLLAGDILVISGSIPNTLPEDIYERILQKLDGRGIDMVVDAEGSLLTNVLKYHPFLIKPNHHELGWIFDVKLETHEEVIPYAKKLQEQGARNVLVSMGGHGAVLVTENGEVYKGDAPEIKVINTVGAGDSMVAGFIAGYLESDGNFERAFLMGQAAGSASAASTELATRSEVEEILKTIHVK